MNRLRKTSVDPLSYVRYVLFNFHGWTKGTVRGNGRRRKESGRKPRARDTSARRYLIQRHRFPWNGLEYSGSEYRRCVRRSDILPLSPAYLVVAAAVAEELLTAHKYVPGFRERVASEGLPSTSQVLAEEAGGSSGPEFDQHRGGGFSTFRDSLPDREGDPEGLWVARTAATLF